MKKFCFIALLAVFSLSVTACYEKDDFNTDSISLGELKPTFLLPLLQDTLSLMNNGNIATDDNMDVFFFNISNFDFPASSEWFSIPDQSGLFSQTYSLPSNGGIPVPVENELTETINITLNQTDRRLDSAKIASLTLVVDFGSTQAFTDLQIWSPQITVNGAPYIYTASTASLATQTIVIPNCTFEPASNGSIDIVMNIKEIAPGNGGTKTVNADISITDLQYSIVYGYFGQSTKTMEDSVSIDFVKNWDMNGDAQFALLKLVVGFQNSIGIPLHLSLDKATVYDKNNTIIGQVTNFGPDASIDILYPEYYDPYRTVISNKDTIKIPELADLLSVSAKKVVFTFSITSNVTGDNTTMNSLTSTASIQTVGTSVRIPLRLKMQNAFTRDTIDLNASSVSMQNMVLRALIKNSMPADLSLQVTLLEKDTDNPLSDLFATPLDIPAPTVVNEVSTGINVYDQDITITEQALEDMKNSEKAIVTIGINTVGNDYVQFSRNNNVAIKIGARATFSYDDLLD